MRYKKKKIKSNQGILFWVTGLQGAGKTEISKKIRPYVEKLFGKTVFCDGDMLRKIFLLKDYSEKGRLSMDKMYRDFCSLIIKNNINLIFATVSMSHAARKTNRKRFKNYIEIYIKRKKLYRQKVRKKIFISIDKEKIELPKNSDFIINNNYKIEHSISKLKTFLNKINKKNTIS